jgi:DNA primase
MNIEKIYDYRDESEQLLYQVVRYKPKDFRQRRPDGKDGWIWNLDGVKPVLYRLPEMIKAPTQDFVIIAEGEKDVDRLCEYGFTATTCPMGAGKWSDEFNKYFEGRLVVIIPDNDDIGKKHAQQVANSLYGIAGDIRIVELPGLPGKGDVSDWFDAGHDKAELAQLSQFG